MATPKDYIIYIEKDTNNTQAAIDDWTGDLPALLEREGHKIIGKISASSKADAIAYGDQVLR
jgi:hypothetical protein